MEARRSRRAVWRKKRVRREKKVQRRHQGVCVEKKEPTCHWRGKDKEGKRAQTNGTKKPGVEMREKRAVLNARYNCPSSYKRSSNGRDGQGRGIDGPMKKSDAQSPLMGACGRSNLNTSVYFLYIARVPSVSDSIGLRENWRAQASLESEVKPVPRRQQRI